MSLLSAVMAQIFRAVAPPVGETYEVFLASGTFNVPAGVSSVDVLLVAGGGGGGGFNGFTNGAGGGGAGGVRVVEGLAVTPSGTVTVTIGAGGDGGASNKGSEGNASSFGAETTVGGGGGMGYTGAYTIAGVGGSGGGAAGTVGTQSGAAGTVGQGNAGGDVSGGQARPAAGGGGKDAAAANVTANNATAGGAGITLASIEWDAAAGAPEAVGGGGGGGRNAAPGAAGGVGGGGAGTASGTGTAGTANTGGGGGGGGGVANSTGGAGGSGLVIVRWVAPPSDDPWTPLENLPTLWYDFNDNDTITLTSSLISALLSKGTHAATLLQGTSSQRPALSSINSLQSGDFTPVASKRLTISAGIPANLLTSQSGYIFAQVVQWASVPAIRRVTFALSVDNQTTPRFFVSSTPDGKWRLEVRRQNADTTAFLDSVTSIDVNPVLLTVVVDHSGTLAQIYINGSLDVENAAFLTAGTTSTTNTNSIWVGTNSTAWSVADIGEQIFHQGTVSQADRQRIEGYLAWKWGLEGDLPADHPYKSAAPTITGDPYWPNVSSLLHMDGADASTTFTDETGKTWTAQNSADIRTDESKFGGASGWFRNTPASGSENSSRITTPDHADLRLGTEDFTIEGWFIPQVPALGFGAFYRKGQNTANGMMLAMTPTQLTLRANTTTDTNVAVTLSTSDWSHVAICRQGTTIRFYVNGVQAGSATRSFDHTSTDPQFVGSVSGDPRFSFNGRIDDYRITKGICRYPDGTTFTPPTEAFPEE